MTILKLVQGKFILAEVAHCADDTLEVTIKLIGLDYEDYRTLMEAYKIGMEVQVRPVKMEEGGK